MKKAKREVIEKLELQINNYYGSVFIRKWKFKNTITHTIFLEDYDVDIEDTEGKDISEDLYNKLRDELSYKVITNGNKI